LAGIFAVLIEEKMKKVNRKRLKTYAFKLKHRGSIQTFMYEKFPLYLFFHQDKPLNNNQTLNFAFSEDNKDLIVIDGFIYNLNEISNKFNNFNNNIKNSNLNLAILLEGYREFGPRIFTHALGSYSGILYINKELIAFKDPIGAKPLYYCKTNEFFTVSSELKALVPLNEDIIQLTPGYVISSSRRERKFFQFPNFVKDYSISVKLVNKLKKKLNKLIRKAISNNIQNGEKVGLILRGGIDSVIIAHIAKDLVPNLKVYIVGTEGSKDLLFAKQFVKNYNLNHFIVKITRNDILEVIPEIIYALETYDTTLIHKAIPIFILSQYIKKNSDINVLLISEGGDELFGGYEYLADLKKKNSLNQELLSLINMEYKTGLQRVDRIPYHFSIEARAPLFDRKLVEFSLSIPPELKIFKNKYGKVYKWILRKAFEDEIPEEFIWRRWQRLSNRVGTQFLSRDYFEDKISNEEIENQKQITSSIRIRSKEELYYWKIFKSKFNLTEKTLLQISVANNIKV
jgi:asparagine synthase (glutamine-hydrolysing)